MKKKIIIAFIMVGIILTAGLGVGTYFVNYALSPVSQSDQRNVDDEVIPTGEDQKIIEKNKKTEISLGNEFKKKTQEVTISSHDDIQLKGKYISKKDQHLWAIMIHGYKSSSDNMMSYGMVYEKRGYNVLLPDNRAHGASEGEYIGMGWLDKDDIASWVDWIVKQDSQAQIILHGVSMGSATTMMASGDNLEHVIGYIEDCGYTSVWDIFASELDKRFSLPTFPVLDVSNWVAQMKAGYDFKEASSVEQLKKTKNPILFIHGGKDDFVPTEMVKEVYEAATCEKDMFIVEPAGHAESKDYNPEVYWNKVFTFIHEKILKK
ncbi:MAG: alpha/beta hydrolase [Longibaculum sp.]